MSTGVPEGSVWGFQEDVEGLLADPDLGTGELVGCVELRRAVWGLTWDEARRVLGLVERNPM